MHELPIRPYAFDALEPLPDARTMEVHHDYDAYTLTLVVYRCALPFKQEARPLYVSAIAWVRPEDFSSYTFPGADQMTVDQLVGEIRAGQATFQAHLVPD